MITPITNVKNLEIDYNLISNVLKDHYSLQASHLMYAGMLFFIAAVITGIGIAYLAGKFLEASTRQPEHKEFYFSNTLIFVGLIDSFSAIAVGFALLLAFASPFHVNKNKIEKCIESLLSYEINNSQELDDYKQSNKEN
jgi:F-type H+-transporting ATPase subunit c